MGMVIRRDYYLNQLISRKWNGMIKVITGMRRSGKSYLLFNLFVAHLKSSGITDDEIIRLELDRKENEQYRSASALYEYIKERINSRGRYYVLIDEIQLAGDAFQRRTGRVGFRGVRGAMRQVHEDRLRNLP